MGTLYGSTESFISSYGYFTRGDDLPDKPLGNPVPHAEIQLVDKNGQVVTNGTAGEIWVRSPYCLQVCLIFKPGLLTL